MNSNRFESPVVFPFCGGSQQHVYTIAFVYYSHSAFLGQHEIFFNDSGDVACTSTGEHVTTVERLAYHTMRTVEPVLMVRFQQHHLVIIGYLAGCDESIINLGKINKRIG